MRSLKDFSPSASIMTVVVVLSVIFMLFGCVGNGWVYYRLKRRNVPHFLFASLLVNGMISTLLKWPSRLVMYISQYTDNLAYTEYACTVFVPSTWACGVINAVTLSLMAIDRQDCVLRPFRRRLTIHNIRSVITLLWIGALGPSLVILLTYLFGKTDCTEFGATRYVALVLGALNLSSFIVIVTTAVRTIKSLRSSPLPQVASLHRRQANQYIWLTYKISGISLCCWLPAFVTSSLVRTGAFRHQVLIDAILITTTVTEFPYVVNPIVFYKYLLSTKVNSIQQQLRATQGRQPVQPVASYTTSLLRGITAKPATIAGENSTATTSGTLSLKAGTH